MESCPPCPFHGASLQLSATLPIYPQASIKSLLLNFVEAACKLRDLLLVRRSVRPSDGHKVSSAFLHEGLAYEIIDRIRTQRHTSEEQAKLVLQRITQIGAKFHLRAFASLVSAHERSVLLWGKVLREFEDGVCVMDEVDMIMHPLRSELNFPRGERGP